MCGYYNIAGTTTRQSKTKRKKEEHTKLCIAYSYPGGDGEDDWIYMRMDTMGV